MSDRVSQLIDSIKSKALELHQELQSERIKSNHLEEELMKIKSEINAKSAEIELSQKKITELGDQIKTLSEQKVDLSSVNDISDEQIDELVKEIEFCIAQLNQ